MADVSDETRENPFDELLDTPSETGFSTGFRGYDRDEVDQAVARLKERAQLAHEQLADAQRDRQRTAVELKTQKEKAERLAAELSEARQSDAAQRIAHLEGELTATTAKLDAASKQVRTLTDELKAIGGEAGDRPNFEEILRVAEEQANVIINSASVHAERLLEAAREQAEQDRKEAQAEADSVIAQANSEATQARLRIETEVTAHETRLEREAKAAAEKISQAEQEAAAIRSEAEKGVAALRSLVNRETQQQRADAEAALREIQLRTTEFEASLTRRQDEAQQEFLLLHNQAVAHAERITSDANDQVTASLEHAKRVSTKADEFERYMRAQAQQIEAEASMRARERLEDAHGKAQHILDLVAKQSQTVLRDAEDRARQLRWQQHELTGFVAEVGELIRLASGTAIAEEILEGDGTDDESAGEDEPGVAEEADADDEKAED